MKARRKPPHRADQGLAIPNFGPLRIEPRRAASAERLNLAPAPSPTAHGAVDELIRELARYCAEFLYETQFSAKPANDDS